MGINNPGYANPEIKAALQQQLTAWHTIPGETASQRTLRRIRFNQANEILRQVVLSQVDQAELTAEPTKVSEDKVTQKLEFGLHKQHTLFQVARDPAIKYQDFHATQEQLGRNYDELLEALWAHQEQPEQGND